VTDRRPVLDFSDNTGTRKRSGRHRATDSPTSLVLRCILAASFGGLGALSLAPFYWTPFLFVAFTGLFWLIDRARTRRDALLMGWLFGLGYFLIGLSWIAESFYVDAEQFGALAVPAIGGLSAFLALFPALACSVAKAAAGTGWRLLLALAASWSAAEWIRGHILTGFPWNLIGYAWGAADETLQAASLFGIYGLGFVTVILATMPGLALDGIARRGMRRWGSLVISIIGVFALWGFGAVRLAGPEPADVTGVRLRIVHRFGRRAETLPEDQLLLGLEEVEQGVAADEAAAETAAPALRTERAAKRRANRGSLPAHLPRIETVVDIEDKACPCCRHALHVIGEDVAERLDIVPAQFRVLVTRRPRYGCRSCEGIVVQAPAPARLIEGGIPTEATVAQVLCPNMPTICRSTARRRSTPARVSISTARPWPTGSAGRRSCSDPSTSELWRKLGDDGLRKAAYRGGC
jgi:hypothetical protein